MYTMRQKTAPLIVSHSQDISGIFIYQKLLKSDNAWAAMLDNAMAGEKVTRNTRVEYLSHQAVFFVSIIWWSY